MIRKKELSPRLPQPAAVCEKPKTAAPGRFDRALVGISAAASTMLCSTEMTFAADVFDKIGKAFGNIFNRVSIIVTVAAALVVGVSLLLMILDDEQGAQRHKNRIKRVAVAWAVFMCLGYIITYAEGLFKGMGYKYK